MSRNEKLGSEKKSVLAVFKGLPVDCLADLLPFCLPLATRPLNPVLGELFFGHWPDRNGRGQTDLAVEQVSHHPPITAYYLENKTKGVSLVGASGQKTSFSFPSIIVRQNGHATLTVKLASGESEQYLITLPRLRIDGLVTGSPYIELTDTSNIQSSTGFLATIVRSSHHRPRPDALLSGD
jgi:hypothetical protein